MEIVESHILQAVILTKNEEPNLKRVLDKLTWLERVVILDSFSTDSTLEISSLYPNVKVAQRVFDTHANQWNFGLSMADSKWILSLDADYVLTDGFIQEAKQFINNGDKSAYNTDFEFLVFGKALRGNNTTSRPVLFKKSDCIYFDDGHTQRLKITGEEGSFKSKILHDDRKSLSRWLSNQDGYSIKESKKLADLSNPDNNSVINKIRRTKIFAPFLVFFYCLIIKGLILDGWRGWYYTLQRTLVEIMFALRLIEEEKLSEKK
jgi:glycosyltransferase involved in cell wall biosynthesis